MSPKILVEQVFVFIALWRLELELGLAIYLERRRLGVDQQELADRLGSGYSRPVLSKIERGRRKLKAGEFELILKAMKEQEALEK